MDFQTILENAVSAERNKRLKTSPQLTLGELVAKLESVKPVYQDYEGEEKPKVVVFNFEYLHPTGLDSWRGSYSELAIEFSADGEAPTVIDFLSSLKAAVGKEFSGYKGGEFVMGKNTPLWVANYGNSGNTGIVGVRDTEYKVILLTDYCKY